MTSMLKKSNLNTADNQTEHSPEDENDSPENLIRPEDENNSPEDLIMDHLWLVASVASKYKGRGIPFIDLTQEGNIGLIIAARRFKPDKGAKFSTYARWWIRQCIVSAISNDSRVVRIPINMLSNIGRFNRVKQKVLTKSGREPTIDEIAKEMQIHAKDVQHIITSFQTMIFLDAPSASREGENLQDSLKDDKIKFPEDSIDNKKLITFINDLIKCLDEREQEIIKLRYDLDPKYEQSSDPKNKLSLGSKDGWTLDAVGKKFGVTRERIRQIEAKAIEKMRTCLNEKGIEVDLED